MLNYLKCTNITVYFVLCYCVVQIYVLSLYQQKQIKQNNIMKAIKNENGYLLFTLCESEITIDNIKVYEQKKGTGKKMINELKNLARELNLPIGLYSYPQDDTINQDDLNDFYYSCGFELDPDDCDNKLFIWKP